MKNLIILFTLLLSMNLSAKLFSDEWTLMFYLNGDNNLSPYMETTLKRIEQVGANWRVNVVVLFDGQESGDSLLYYYKGKKRVIIEKDIEFDMGSPDTVAKLVQVAKERFPAKRYALSIYSHGRGILNLPVGDGASFGPSDSSISYLVISPDEESGTFLDEQEMVASLKDVLGEEKLDLLVMNSCLMGNTGVALTMAPIAKKMIASEFMIALYRENMSSVIATEGIGINMGEMIADIKAHPKDSVEELAAKTIDRFYDGYKRGMLSFSGSSESRKVDSILTLFDLEQADHFKTLLQNMADEYMAFAKQDPSYIDVIYEHLLQNRLISGVGYIDLGVMANLVYSALGLESAKDLSEYINQSKQLIPYSRDVHIDYPVSGISIFFPVLSLIGSEYDQLLSFYTTLDFEQEIGWNRLIRDFSSGYEERRFEMKFKLFKRYLDGENVVVLPGEASIEENEHQLLSLIIWAQVYDDLEKKNFDNIEKIVFEISQSEIESFEFNLFRESIVQMLVKAHDSQENVEEKVILETIIQRLK